MSEVKRAGALQGNSLRIVPVSLPYILSLSRHDWRQREFVEGVVGASSVKRFAIRHS